MRNYNTCVVVDDPVVSFAFRIVCMGGMFLPIIVIDLSIVGLLMSHMANME